MSKEEMLIVGVVLMVGFGFLSLKTKGKFERNIYMIFVILGAVLFGSGIGLLDAF